MQDLMRVGTGQALPDVEKVCDHEYREKRRFCEDDQNHSDHSRGGDFPFRFGTAYRLRTHTSRLVANVGKYWRGELKFFLFEFPIGILRMFQVPERAPAPDFRQRFEVVLRRRR